MLIRRIARPMLSATFIVRGVDALRNPKPAADAARPSVDLAARLSPQVADASTVAQVTAVAQIGGGLLLASGRLPRLASAVLAASVVPGSLGAHQFWNESDPQRQAEERRAFITDISLIGGLIIAAADTAGKPSLGWWGRRAARQLSETVTAALPAGASAHESLIDSDVAEKVGHGLHVGAERGRELAEVALDRATELAGTVREHAPEVAELARDRGTELAEAAKKHLDQRLSR